MSLTYDCPSFVESFLVSVAFDRIRACLWLFYQSIICGVPHPCAAPLFIIHTGDEAR